MIKVVYKNRKIELELTASTIYVIVFLLEEIVFLKNPITNGNEKLKKKLKKIIFEKNRVKIIDELCNYLNENKTIDLEAYAIFKLNKHSQELDNILYSSMKKFLMR